MGEVVFQIFYNGFLFTVFFLKTMILFIRNEAQLVPDGRESLVSIVLSQQYPIFCPRGEHPVGILDSFRHQIVDEHPYVGLRAGKYQGLMVVNRTMRVDASHQSLASRFLITGGAVHLARKVQMLYTF